MKMRTAIASDISRLPVYLRWDEAEPRPNDGSADSETPTGHVGGFVFKSMPVRMAVPQPPPRVTVVACDESMHSVLRSMLAGQPEEWALDEYECPEQAIAALPLSTSRPDAIVTDIAGSNFADIAHLTRLKALMPGVPVLVVTERRDADSILASLRAGAFGYLFKPIEAGELASAILEAIHGYPPLVLQAETLLLDLLQAGAALGRAMGLTRRENQAIGCVLAGLSDAEIAGRLSISGETVHVHLVNAFAKLNAHSREEVAKRLLLGEPAEQCNPVNQESQERPSESVAGSANLRVSQTR